MNEEELMDKLVTMFMKIKSTKFHNIVKMDNITHNEKLVLFLINKLLKNDKISLSTLRENINLAPSTITPIVTSLEEKGFIYRNIDREDRRNIYIELTNEGKKLTSEANDKMKTNLMEFIRYMGKDDTLELVRLLSKTSKFLEERNDN